MQIGLSHTALASLTQMKRVSMLYLWLMVIRLPVVISFRAKAGGEGGKRFDDTRLARGPNQENFDINLSCK
jgi:hypothetical protein